MEPKYRKTITPDELLAAETGTIVKHGEGFLNVALAYPNTYFVGMSSLGFQTIYQLGNQRDDVRVERFFTDLPAAETLESGAPLSKADVLAFSVSFELDFVNILDILERAGLPILARERTADMPLVVAGGLGILVNRLPIYDVCDVFAHGAGERIAGPLFDGCAQHKNDRARLLRELSTLPGIEVTAGAQAAAGIDLSVELQGGASASAREAAQRQDLRPKPPAPCQLTSLDPHPPYPSYSSHPSYSVLLTPHTAFSNKCLIEISRGCPHRCTFCWAGHNITPYAIRSAGNVIALIESQRLRTRSFGLIAAAVGAHPEIDAICAWCDRHDLLVSFSSLRVEDVTEGMLRTLARSGQKSVTLAPETASPRLRRLLGKQLEDEQVFEAVEQAVSLGMRDVKLYFMTGLPTETEEEADEIVGFVERLRRRFVDASRPKGRIGSIGVNLGVYVSHPKTPLARHAAPPPMPAVRKRLERLTRALRRSPNVRVTPGSIDLAHAQTVLCNAGRSALALLRAAHAAHNKWRPALRQWEQCR